MKDSCILRKPLLNLCQKIYGPREISEKSIDAGKNVNQLVEFARKNRLAHYLALEYSKSFAENDIWKDISNKLICEYNDYEKNLRNALEATKNILGEERFMIIKTFSSFPHLTNDLDVLVPDFKIAEESHKEVLDKKSSLPIDINTKVAWGKADAVSNDFVWNNTQEFNFEGIGFLIPSPALDAIIRIAHIPFEVAHIRLGELLHIYKQLSLSDWTILEDEAKLMGWPKTFGRMLSILELLHRKLFKTPFFQKGIMPASCTDNIGFPFRLPVSILAGGVIEKRAWRKLFGARIIIKNRLSEWIDRKVS